MKDTIRKLVEAYGPSGFEDQIRDIIRKEIGGLADSVRVSSLGSLIAVKKGTGGKNAKRVMLAAHMDEIGLMVTHIDEKGYARVTHIGGIRPLNCIGQRVQFADGTIGVVLAERLEDPSKTPGMEHLFIDTGARNRASSKVKVGDAAGFVQPFVDMGQRIAAKTMDDRIGCAVQIEVMRRLARTPHEVHFVFSVQEEIGLIGARTAGYEINPDVAIAIDVTLTGDTPKALPMAVELGKGPAIKVQDGMMIAHAGVKNLMIRRAEESKTPYQLEILRAGSTDAAAIQLAREGVPSGCVSIPCRYVHSQSEMVDTTDVLQCVNLLLAILRKPIEV
ncbi:MAG TPA: M42 family metallopeptidase [Anaerolineae bacterium]|nr:M42 family metallopeptidase [Anaerolineae bacterium]